VPPTAVDLSDVYLKLEWAEVHIETLRSEIDASNGEIPSRSASELS
jgi:hypothetical protein